MTLSYHLAKDNPPTDALADFYRQQPDGSWQLDVRDLPLPADAPSPDAPSPDAPSPDAPTPDAPTPDAAPDAAPDVAPDADTSDAPQSLLTALNQGQGSGTPSAPVQPVPHLHIAHHDSTALNANLTALASGRAVLLSD